MEIQWNLKQNQQRSTPHQPTAQLLTLDNIASILDYNSEYQVLFCTQHHCAIQNLHDHLRDQHVTTPAHRTAIVQHYARFPRLPPQDVLLPLAQGSAFSQLGPPIKAFECDGNSCGFITVNISEIRKHCNRVHHWRASRHEKSYWHTVHAQTFFRNPQVRRYFTVVVQHDEATTLVPQTVEDQHDIQIVQQQWAELRQRHRKQLDILDETIAKHDRTGWFNRTGWPDHLAKQNLKQLANMSRLPDRDEHSVTTGHAARLPNGLPRCRNSQTQTRLYRTA